jgi:hypothetical protein
VLLLLIHTAVDVQSKVAAASGKKNVTAKEFNTYLAANKVRPDHTFSPLF